jgi:hypothetical protein
MHARRKLLLVSLLLLGLVRLGGAVGPSAAENAALAPEAGPESGVVFDLQGFVDKEAKAGARRIVVPPGRYRVAPRDRQHLLLQDLNDVQIVADGVEMICAETTRAITLLRCTNVTVRGFTIDYDPLPYTQGRITAISADKQFYDIELFDGYPDAAMVRNFKYEVFRPDTRTLRCEDRGVSRIETLDSRHLRLNSPGRHEVHPEQIDDLIVIGAEYAPHGSAAHAVECSHCTHARLEDIVLFASNCFGFLEFNCDSSVYERCRVDRRPPEDDPVKRASPRLRSLDADAFHSKHAIKGPCYLECAARFMGDDCVNICGDYHMIMGLHGRDLRVLAKGSMNIQPGDPVELVLYTGERLPDAKAVRVEPAGSILEDERAFLAKQNLDAGLRSGRGLSRAYTITLDRDVAMTRGGIIGSANRMGNGFEVRDCNFGFNRSRGILIKASHGEITGNRMEGCWMSAILVSPEYWWLEAGSSSDLRITGNTITNCGGVPICIEAIGGNGAIAPAGAHRNILIAGNTVAGCALPGILATSTAGLQIGPNTLGHWLESRRIPEPMRRAGLTELEPVVKINCAAALPYAPAPPDNPLKGFVTYPGEHPTFPHSLEWVYTRVSEVMTGPTHFDWAVFERKLDAAAARGCQFCARFYLEYPNRKTGVPQFLLDQALTVRCWTNRSGASSPPEVNLTPDYEDPRLRAALTQFIHAFGARYDGDPRLGFVELGLLGLWGEWHTGPKGHWFASKEVQREVMDAYETAFKRTRLVARYPAGPQDPRYADNNQRPLGYHDDSFAWATVHTGRPGDDWFFETLLRGAGALDNWRRQPIGGEVRPEVWDCLFDEPSCAPEGQDFAACVAVTRVSWLCNQGAFRPALNGAARERAIRAAQSIGYELQVTSADLAMASGELTVTLSVTNTGVAPFYYDWPVELGALDSTGTLAARWTTPWKLTAIQPGRDPVRWQFQTPVPRVAPGTHRLVLGVPNPLASGKPLRFANQAQDRDRAGWLTLGTLEF